MTKWHAYWSGRTGPVGAVRLLRPRRRGSRLIGGIEASKRPARGDPIGALAATDSCSNAAESALFRAANGARRKKCLRIVSGSGYNLASVGKSKSLITNTIP